MAVRAEENQQGDLISQQNNSTQNQRKTDCGEGIVDAARSSCRGDQGADEKAGVDESEDHRTTDPPSTAACVVEAAYGEGKCG